MKACYFIFYINTWSVIRREIIFLKYGGHYILISSFAILRKQYHFFFQSETTHLMILSILSILTFVYSRLQTRIIFIWKLQFIFITVQMVAYLVAFQYWGVPKDTLNVIFGSCFTHSCMNIFVNLILLNARFLCFVTFSD